MKINEIANEKVEQVRDTLDFEVTSYTSCERFASMSLRVCSFNK